MSELYEDQEQLDFQRSMGVLNPSWMNSLDEKDRDEVTKWLTKHGISPDECAWITPMDNGYFNAKMYAVDAQGHGEFRDGHYQYAEPIIFSAKYLPECVVERLSYTRGVVIRPSREGKEHG